MVREYEATVWLTASSFGAIVLSCVLVPLRGDGAGGGDQGARLSPRWGRCGRGRGLLASKVITVCRIRAKPVNSVNMRWKKDWRGGMGEVYRARPAMLRRHTAVKLLSGTIRMQLRVSKRIKLTARSNYPHDAIYNYGRTPTGFYYAMSCSMATRSTTRRKHDAAR